MREKLEKVCDSFMGKSFNISGNGSVSAMESEVEKLNKRIDESAGLI